MLLNAPSLIPVGMQILKSYIQWVLNHLYSVIFAFSCIETERHVYIDILLKHIRENIILKKILKINVKSLFFSLYLTDLHYM